MLNPSSLITRFFTAAAAAVLLLGHSARASDGTWTNTAGGVWSATGNWSGGTVADGSGSTANFNTLDITAATTVHLDSARTIGTLVFSDINTGTAGSWILDNNGNAGNILTLSGTDTITVNAMASVAASSATPNATISAVIAGSSINLIKNGSATTTVNSGAASSTSMLVLSGANTYAGTTDIQTGMIVAKNATALGSSVVTVESGASLVLSTNNAIANTVNLNGANALAAAGSGSADILSGTVNVQTASSVFATNVGGNNSLTFSSVGTLALGSNVLTIGTSGSANTVTIAGGLTGAAASGLNISGGGSVIISGNNGSGYSGTTTVGKGTLVLGSNTALSASTLALAPGSNNTANVVSSGAVGSTRLIANAVTIDNSTSGIYSFGSATTGNLTFTGATAIALPSVRTIQVLNAQTEFDAAFTGVGGGITKIGSGTLVLTNTASTYTGATTIQAGALSVSSLNNFSANSTLGAAASGDIIIGNAATTGTLIYAGTGNTSNRTIRIGTNSGTPAVTDIGGATIQNDGTSGALTFNAATFNSALNTASGVGADRILTLQGSNTASNTISGVIQDNTKSGTATGTTRIGVTKAGAGTWVLSGSNSYTGTTTVTAGTLVVANTTGSATGRGALAVNAGATLAGIGISSGTSFNVSGTSTSARAIVLVGQTSTLDTNTTSTLTLLATGASTIANADLVFNLNVTTPGQANHLDVGSTAITFGSGVNLTLNMINAGIVGAYTQYVLIDGTTNGQYAGLTTFTNSLGQLQISSGLSMTFGDGLSQSYYGNGSYLFLNNGDIDVEVVPEPSTWAMMIGGLAVLVFILRRKSKLG